MRILVADDTGVLVPTCVVFLAYWGHEVEVALDGIEALRRARAWRPDAVLARIGLERMDGLSLVAALRADPALREIPVVLAGPAEDLVRRGRARELGVTAWLATPLAVADLHQHVSRLADAHGELAGARGGARAARGGRRAHG